MNGSVLAAIKAWLNLSLKYANEDEGTNHLLCCDSRPPTMTVLNLNRSFEGRYRHSLFQTILTNDVNANLKGMVHDAKVRRRT